MWPLRPWWNATYALDRLGRAIYERRCPDAPWLTRQAVGILDSFLRPSDRALEWGSGRSTLWLGRRVGHLTSIEDSAPWRAQIERRLEEAKMTNVRYLLCEPAANGNNSYVDVVEEFGDESLDFALVDGSYRSECANRVLTKLRPGGMLAVDNANRFLPSHSRSPKSISAGAPPRCASESERRPGLGWADFLARVEKWRTIWTCDGVADTVFWLRPPG